jgi:antitoxin CptB
MNDFIKKLIYRSLHRGCKEMDVILGAFVASLSLLSTEILQTYEQLLEEADWNIYAWIIGDIETPQKYLELINKIRLSMER